MRRQATFFEHRHGRRGPRTADINERTKPGIPRNIGLFSPDVCDMLKLFCWRTSRRECCPRAGGRPIDGAETRQSGRRASRNWRKTEYLPSYSRKVAKLDSQMRVAFSNIALKTGANSPGELLMTLSTSAVAVCCSSDSRSSSSRPRTFSIAITAWSAKVLTSSICLSVNGRTTRRRVTSTPIGCPSRKKGDS